MYKTKDQNNTITSLNNWLNLDMFEPLHKIFNQIATLEIDNVMLEVWNQQKVKDIIIDLNRISQLYNSGIDSNGKSLGNYAESTIIRKKRKSQPYDHITLNDTDEFYQSFEVYAFKGGFEISANTIKRGDGLSEDVNLTEKYGQYIIGLTEISKDLLIESVNINIKNEIYLRITRR